MEQNILPKKIKIAIFLMLAAGILALIQFVFIISMAKIIVLDQINSSQYNIFSVILVNFEILLAAILFIVFAYFLKKKKKWAWFAAIAILLKETVAGIKSISLFFSVQMPQLMEYIPPSISTLFLIITIISVLGYILILISLIFLILERKNYWKVAS